MFWTIILSCAFFVATAFVLMQLMPKKRLLEQEPDYFNSLLKVIALVFFAVCFTREIFYDTFILVINDGWFNGHHYQNSDVLHSIVRWGHSVATVAFPMAAFFRSRLFKNISLFISLPFALVAIANFNDFIAYYMNMGMAGRGLVVSLEFRQFFLALDLMLAVSFPVLLLVCGKHTLDFTNKKELFVFLIVLPFVIIRMCPVNVPQSIFGYTTLTYDALTVGNVVWILLIITEIFVLNQLFRFRSYRDRYMLCMFLALACFVEYNSIFMMGFNIKRLPFQLCNLGAYFFVVALLIKNVKFFNFVFLANITGAIIAIVSPDTEGGGAASFWGFHYFVEHTLTLVVPMMCNLLRIFPRVNNVKAIKHFTVGFACYYAFCLVLGTVLNGISDLTNQPNVNFFYIFDMTLVKNTLPFFEPLTKGFTLFNRFELYPMFQLVVFGVFWFLCVLFYFMVQKLYAMVDDHFELRLARIELQEKLTKKKSKAKREFAD